MWHVQVAVGVQLKLQCAVFAIHRDREDISISDAIRLAIERVTETMLRCLERNEIIGCTVHSIVVTTDQ